MLLTEEQVRFLLARLQWEPIYEDRDLVLAKKRHGGYSTNMDIAKIEAGQLQLSVADYSMKEVVANVIESYRFEKEAREHAGWSDPLFTAADTAGLASWHSPRRIVSSGRTN